MRWNRRAVALAATAGVAFSLAPFSLARAGEAATTSANADTSPISDALREPTLVLTRRDWDESGKFSLGDYLQTLPEQGNAPNLLVNNGGDGATRINLRSLGVERTLVLVDGKRVVNSGVGTSSSVDLNTVPDAAVGHVEVLTDGASALYGSGAVAGVVNILTRRGFEGVEARANYGMADRGDGQTTEVNILNGHSGDRASYLLTLSFFDQRPVYAGDRGWSSQLQVYDFNSGATFRSASSVTPQGSVGLFAAECLALCSALFSSKPSPSGDYIRDPGAPLGWRPFTTADQYNFAPPNYLSTPTRRAQIFLDGDFKFENVRAYYQAWYTRHESEQRLAPQPLFTGEIGFVVSADNLYNPFGSDLYDVRRRLVEFGPRTYREDAGTYRVVAGLDGILGSAGPFPGWKWDLAANYGRSSGTLHTKGLFLNSRMAAALGPSMLVGGAPRCVAIPGDPGSVIAGCTPLNLFGGPGSIDGAQVDYLRFDGKSKMDDSLLSLTGNLSGELITLPSGKRATLSLGYEFRREQGSETVDPEILAGEVSDLYFPSARGSQTAHEVRAELTAPLLADGPVIKLFEIDAAADYAHYHSFGSVFSYKVGGQFAVGDAKLYGSYSRSYRAPDLREAYGPVTLTFPFAADPCVYLFAVPEKVAAQCVATGVPAGGTFFEVYQQPTIEGGNPHLGPEKAETFMVGLTYAPKRVPGLSFNFDYYRINVDDVIGASGATAILDRCYPFNDAAPDPQACALIARDPATGVILQIDDTLRSNGSLKTDGLDFQMRAEHKTAIGTFGFDLNSNWVNSYTRASIAGPIILGAGNYDLGAVPRFKANAELTWRREGWGARLGARYVSSFKECEFDACYQPDPFLKSTSRRIPSYVVFDAQLSRHFIRWSMGQTDISVGVNNLFDRTPPFVTNALEPNSDSTLYDFLGRFVYVRLTHTLDFKPFH